MADLDTYSGIRELLYSRIFSAICELEVGNTDWHVQYTKLSSEHIGLLEDYDIYIEDYMEDDEEEFEESDIVEGDIDDNSENIQVPIDGYAEFALFLKDKVVRIVVCKYTAVIYRSNDVENWRRIIPTDFPKDDVKRICQYIEEV